jgi:hypothetical protein
MFVGAPPDANPITTEQAIEALQAAIMRDPGVDPHEMRLLGAFFMWVKTYIASTQQMGQEQQQGQEFEAAAPSTETSDIYSNQPEPTTPVG